MAIVRYTYACKQFIKPFINPASNLQLLIELFLWKCFKQKKEIDIVAKHTQSTQSQQVTGSCVFKKEAAAGFSQQQMLLSIGRFCHWLWWLLCHPKQSRSCAVTHAWAGHGVPVEVIVCAEHVKALIQRWLSKL